MRMRASLPHMFSPPWTARLRGPMIKRNRRQDGNDALPLLLTNQPARAKLGDADAAEAIERQQPGRGVRCDGGGDQDLSGSVPTSSIATTGFLMPAGPP